MDEQTTLRVIDIVPGTSVDGPGLRTSIYFAGCSHCCEGCHNPQSWPFDAGRDMTIPQIIDVIEENGFNVTFSGGDPIYQALPLAKLAEEIVKRGYNIWCYTGFMFEDLLKMPACNELLPNIEVVVDGPFMIGLRDISLLFRGSKNQRIIDVKQSLASGEISLWDESPIAW